MASPFVPSSGCQPLLRPSRGSRVGQSRNVPAHFYLLLLYSSCSRPQILHTRTHCRTPARRSAAYIYARSGRAHAHALSQPLSKTEELLYAALRIVNPCNAICSLLCSSAACLLMDRFQLQAAVSVDFQSSSRSRPRSAGVALCFGTGNSSPRSPWSPLSRALVPSAGRHHLFAGSPCTTLQVPP